MNTQITNGELVKNSNQLPREKLNGRMKRLYKDITEELVKIKSIDKVDYDDYNKHRIYFNQTIPLNHPISVFGISKNDYFIFWDWREFQPYEESEFYRGGERGIYGRYEFETKKEFLTHIKN